MGLLIHLFGTTWWCGGWLRAAGPSGALVASPTGILGSAGGGR